MLRNQVRDDFSKSSPSVLGKLTGRFDTILSTLKRTLRTIVVDDIARRAFVNNAFDGALTIFGILMGYVVLGQVDPKAIISAGLGASLAMGMSGTFGRFFSERAERKNDLHEIERHLYIDLSDSFLAHQSDSKTRFVSMVDGVSPAMTGFIPLLPFFAALGSAIPVQTAIVASFTLDFIILFTLGLFLGKISDENIWKHGVVMVGIGLITGILIFLGSYVISLF
jgi:predicted membrane protein (TIGR00267 family)